jgi:DNA-binding MarR family transcriptional regulator
MVDARRSPRSPRPSRIPITGVEENAMKGRPTVLEPTIAGLARVVEVRLALEDLTIQKYRVLIHLDVAPASATELAARLTVKPPTVTRLVDGLVERGLVERLIDERDRRRSTHVITEAGRDAVRRANAGIRTSMGHISRWMTEEDRVVAEQGLILWGDAMRVQWKHTRENGLTADDPNT